MAQWWSSAQCTSGAAWRRDGCRPSAARRSWLRTRASLGCGSRCSTPTGNTAGLRQMHELFVELNSHLNVNLMGAMKLLENITSWENSKAAEMEAELKKMQEQLEKKKARCLEKLKNNAAMVHKDAEEKGAAAEARCGEEIVAAEEAAARYRAKGEAPKKLLFEALRG